LEAEVEQVQTLQASAARARSQEEEEAEYGDERRKALPRESDRLERLRRKMDEEENGARPPARKTRDGFLLQCAFCDITEGITCVDSDSGAVQHCARCAKTYRATPATAAAD